MEAAERLPQPERTAPRKELSVGDVVGLVFGGLACVGLALVALGAARRARVPFLSGCAVLLALAGAWVLGPFGALLGAVPFLALRR